MAGVGLAMNPPHTEERAVFTQLKPVRMPGADAGEDSSVFEEVKPAVRIYAVVWWSVAVAMILPGIRYDV